MALIGGYFGFYAIISRCEIFGSAQTGNLIYLVRDIVGWNLYDFLLRVGGLLLYVLAIILTILIPRYCSINLQLLSIFIDIAAAVILGFFPEEMNPIIGLYPIFFAMSFQWCSFKGMQDCPSATTFSTNNLRQFVTALTHFFADKTCITRIKFYGFTLMAFHLGVAISYILWNFFHIYSIWFCIILLAAALLLTLAQRKSAYGRSSHPQKTLHENTAP